MRPLCPNPQTTPSAKKRALKAGLSPTPPRVVREKLCNTQGFVRAEQMASILFIGLLCVIISVGLAAAFQSYRLAQETTRSHELLARAISEVNDELAFAHSIEGSGADCAYVSPTTHTLVRLKNSANGTGIVFAEAAQSPATETLFIPSLKDLSLAITQVEYNDDAITNDYHWSYRIEVLRASDKTVLAGTDMTVAWIG